MRYPRPWRLPTPPSCLRTSRPSPPLSCRPWHLLVVVVRLSLADQLQVLMVPSALPPKHRPCHPDRECAVQS
eukprot:443326-Pyramimonas_sp.AAC.1